MTTELWAMGLALIATLMGSMGPIFLKKGSAGFGLSLKGLLHNYNLMIGVFFYGLGTVLFIPALRGGELSVLYPLVSTTYIWVSLFSIKMLKEKMNKQKWLGIFIIILGVAMIGVGAN